MLSRRALLVALVWSMLVDARGVAGETTTAPARDAKITVLDLRNEGAWFPNERAFLPNERMLRGDRNLPGFIRVAAMDVIKRVPSLSFPNVKRSLSEIPLGGGGGEDPAPPSETASAGAKRQHSIKVLGIRAQTTWYPNELHWRARKPGTLAPYLPPPIPEVITNSPACL